MDYGSSVLSELDGDRDLRELEERLSEFDAFSFLGISRDEGFHSRVLTWLLDPRGSHSAGDFFLRNFLLETGAATREQVQDTGWSTASIVPEWHNTVDGATGRLDILILNSESSFVCGIENKIFSGEHSRQLTRYREALEGLYGNWHRSYLLLSPEGIPPIDPEERGYWKPVGYRTVLNLVETTLKCSGP